MAAAAGSSPNALIAMDTPVKHTQFIVTEDEIPILFDIHSNRSLEFLQKKAPQQHVDNCWQDSAMMIFFQSDPTYIPMWEHILLIILNELISKKGGNVRALYYRQFRNSVSNIFKGRFKLYAPPHIFTYLACRYIRKLFQIYELSLGIDDDSTTTCGECGTCSGAPAAAPPPSSGFRQVSSANIPRANAVKNSFYESGLLQGPGGRLADIHDSWKILSNIVPNVNEINYTEYETNKRYIWAEDEITDVYDVIIEYGEDQVYILNPKDIYAYYILVTNNESQIGHIISLVKVNGVWGLYDNENYELVYSFSPEENTIVNENILVYCEITLTAGGAEPSENSYILSFDTHIPMTIRFGYSVTLSEGETNSLMYFDQDSSWIFYRNPHIHVGGGRRRATIKRKRSKRAIKKYTKRRR